MPAVTNLTLADATPTNHSYVPQSATVGQTVLVNKEGNIYAGNPRLQLGFSPASKSRATSRVSINFDFPLERQDDAGNYYVAGNARMIVDIVSPDIMTATEKSDFAALIESIFADSTVQGYVSSDDPMY
jgi:hypothetical protein